MVRIARPGRAGRQDPHPDAPDPGHRGHALHARRGDHQLQDPAREQRADEDDLVLRRPRRMPDRRRSGAVGRAADGALVRALPQEQHVRLDRTAVRVDRRRRSGAQRRELPAAVAPVPGGAGSGPAADQPRRRLVGRAGRGHAEPARPAPADQEASAGQPDRGRTEADAVTYSGQGTSSSAPVYAQIVDKKRNIVVGNMVTPIRLVLDGLPHTTTFTLEEIAASVEADSSYELQIIPATSVYGPQRVAGLVTRRASAAPADRQVREQLDPHRGRRCGARRRCVDMVPPMAELREVATGLKFPEGPVAMSDGSVIVVEIAQRHGHACRHGRLQGGDRAPGRRPERRGDRPRRQPLRLQQRRRVRLPRDGGHGGHPRAAPAAEQLQRRAHRAHRPRLRRGRGRSTRSATAARCAHRTTSCSTDTAASTSPTTGSASTARPIAPASSTRRPTAPRSARSSRRSTRPTGSGSRPTARACTWRRPTPRACGTGRSPGPGDVTVPEGLLPHGGELLDAAAGLPVPRLAGGGRRGQRVRGDARVRRHHDRESRGRLGGRVRRRRRPVRDQHLLRRRGPADGLHHAVGCREAGPRFRGRGRAWRWRTLPESRGERVEAGGEAAVRRPAARWPRTAGTG